MESHNRASIGYSTAFTRFRIASAMSGPRRRPGRPGLLGERALVALRRRSRYSLSLALLSSGAARYFSKRARKRRLLATFHTLPSNCAVSEPGSMKGTSLPSMDFGLSGWAPPPLLMIVVLLPPLPPGAG